MEQTKSYTCSYCQSEAVFSTVKLRAGYGWMSCPNCGKVSHFEPKLGSQYQAASFHLRSKEVKSAQPVSTPESPPLGFEHPVSATAQSAPISPAGPVRPTAMPNALSSEKQPRRVRVLSVGLLSLCVLIGGWGVFAQRDWLGARWPQTVPWLERFCVVLDCQVQPYQSLQEIDIQSSGLQLLRYGSSDYQLEFVLANRSKTMTVATPFVHLVLLGLNGDVLLRKKLGEKDIRDFPTVLAPQAQWAAQTQIQLDLSTIGVDPQQILFELSVAYE